jgi:hypothetical protein
VVVIVLFDVMVSLEVTVWLEVTVAVVGLRLVRVTVDGVSMLTDKFVTVFVTVFVNVCVLGCKVVVINWV